MAAQTNTFIPFSGGHTIGLTCQIVNANVFAQASNIIVYVARPTTPWAAVPAASMPATAPTSAPHRC